MRLTCLVMGVALSALTGPAHAQVPASRWEDPSEHKVHFVTVEAAVTLTRHAQRHGSRRFQLASRSPRLT